MNRLGYVFALLLSLTPVAAAAATKAEIDANIHVALQRFYTEVPAGKALVERAAGALIFPKVVKAGIGIGGEYGEGALLIHGRPVDYYSIAAASVGFQFGAQVKTELILFLEPPALEKFRASAGWKAGIDGSIALIEVGVGGTLDTDSINQPVIAFVLSNTGLMYNLTLEGSKITKIRR